MKKLNKTNKKDQATDDIESLRSAGFISIARQYKDMISALRVIHIWAIVQILEPTRVVELAEKTLRRFMKLQDGRVK